ncbi:hypothetical protein PBY51_007017 [Eleginops maclovinus]|uniref:Uncharacterized protein n=1 Tax=Eleginops maclovinus TaxID=56733 RepID=A0AAN7X3B5_ELEMC|nr:hypothetical protein PBY51_007017 [Eleginops maclovinus]
MHRHLAVSRRPHCFLPQWTDIAHWRWATGGGTTDALIRAAEALKAPLVLSERLALSPPSSPLKGGRHV